MTGQILPFKKTISGIEYPFKFMIDAPDAPIPSMGTLRARAPFAAVRRQFGVMLQIIHIVHKSLTLQGCILYSLG